MASRVLRPAVFALAAVLVLLLATQAAFGASVGRIKGTVTDSKTGDPLFGVSVQIEGTTMGAKTDIDGNYIILSVPPGTYNLKVTLLSYEGVQVQGVRVDTDQTSENNMQMKQTVIETGKVTIVKGQRKGIDINQTGTVNIRTQKEIQSAPVATVQDLLAKETGITVDAQGELHIRGGRAGETTYLVDGVNYSDPLGGRAPVDAGINISSSAVLELQVIKDGFDPEYGEALSGIVKITSPTGSAQRTRTGLQFYTDDFGTNKLNKYSENYDRGEFNVSGPDPLLTSRILPALGINYFQDKEFTYYLFADFTKTDTRLPYSRYTSPATEKKYSGLNILGINIPDRQNNQYSLDFTLAFNPTNNMQAKALYKGMRSSATDFDWLYRYTPATAPVSWYNTNSVSFQLKQVLSKSSDYEINLSYWGSRYTEKPGDPDHPGEGLDPDDFLFIDQYETYEDIDNDNVFDSYEPFINIFPDSVKYGSIYIPNRNEGDISVAVDDQIGGLWYPSYDLNGNGIIDQYEGEPFVDLNGNGIWDMGDKLTRDINGNGVYDEDLRDATSPSATTREEPYIDGDSSLGEPFTDVNKNGIYDEGIDRFMTALDPTNNQDLNRNNRYDGPNDPWVPGIPYIDYNGNGVYDAPNNRYDPGEPYTDINKNGEHDTGGDNSTGFLLYGYGQGGSYPNVWTEEKVDKYTLKGNLKKAIGRAHEIKTGFELRKEKIGVASIQGLQYYSTTNDKYVYSDRGNVRDFYSRKPYVVVAYFRDKIEYGSLVASLGMRADLFFQDKLEGVSKIQDVTGNKVQKLRNKFSPRVSINYPISEKAMIRFNYGHFYDLPSYTRMYRNSNPYGRGDVSLVGNPNLNYMKTVNYTFGLNYAVTDEYSVKLSGYYKDYFDIVATSTYGTGAGAFSYYDNTDYARIRGFELEFGREASRFINGTLSYTYQFAYGKSSSDAENYQRLLAQDAIPIDENPLDWDIRHRVALWLQMYFTDRDHPRLFGLAIPNDWDMSIYWQFQSGFPFTPQKTYPGMKLDIGESPLTNSMRLPATAYTDIKFHKRFRLSGMEYTFQVWINNLFDNKNVVYVNTATGRPDTDNNQSGVIGGGTERQANPANWGRGRQIILGLGLQF
ncbi:MAG: TonB-dependent receptor [candidate division Zixibacteria bacterium]|nr:TonB-dependent receptor [candidate division Zixibacteria bacterium]